MLWPPSLGQLFRVLHIGRGPQKATPGATGSLMHQWFLTTMVSEGRKAPPPTSHLTALGRPVLPSLGSEVPSSPLLFLLLPSSCCSLYPFSLTSCPPPLHLPAFPIFFLPPPPPLFLPFLLLTLPPPASTSRHASLWLKSFLGRSLKKCKKKRHLDIFQSIVSLRRFTVLFSHFGPSSF